jgi:hypothetical protein
MKPDTIMIDKKYYHRICRVFVPESHINLVDKRDIKVPCDGGIILTVHGKSALDILRDVPLARLISVSLPLNP